MQSIFTGESARTEDAQRQMTADIIQTVFDLVLGSLQQVVQEGTVMDCADGTPRLCFPIWSAWIADQAKQAGFPRIGSKWCPK